MLATGTVLQGWALAKQGQEEEGIAQMRQGLSALQATGAGLSLVVWSGPLAEAYGRVGQPEEGLSVLDEALAMTDETGARLHEAELYRIKGMLTLQKFQVPGSKFQVPPNPQAEAEAEACFHKALEIARRQQAKS